MMKYVSEEALQFGLKDKSAYVRKTAVLGIVKVFQTDPQIVDSKSLVGGVYIHQTLVMFVHAYRNKLC